MPGACILSVYNGCWIDGGFGGLHTATVSCDSGSDPLHVFSVYQFHEARVVSGWSGAIIPLSLAYRM